MMMARRSALFRDKSPPYIYIDSQCIWVASGVSENQIWRVWPLGFLGQVFTGFVLRQHDHEYITLATREALRPTCNALVGLLLPGVTAVRVVDDDTSVIAAIAILTAEGAQFDGRTCFQGIHGPNVDIGKVCLAHCSLHTG